MSAITIKDFSFSYDKHYVLENINLNVENKDFLAIIGPNGGGKSTLVKAIIGLIPTKNSILVFGEKVSKNISKVGYVPQNTNININFPITALEVVLMGHTGHKKPLFGYKKEEKSCAMEALRQVGMEEFSHSKIGSLSGGQRQRVMIARALCAIPKILILDEPTASIDVSGQKKIYELLRQINKRIPIIVVSHDISVVAEYATKVAHINKTLNFHDIENLKELYCCDDHFREAEMLDVLHVKKGCSC